MQSWCRPMPWVMLDLPALAHTATTRHFCISITFCESAGSMLAVNCANKHIFALIQGTAGIQVASLMWSKNRLRHMYEHA